MERGGGQAAADWRSRGGEAMQVAARSSPWGEAMPEVAR